MSTGYLYEPLPDVTAGARLHLNENSAGCSAAVLAAIRSITREQIAWYPAYTSATAACARAFGVSPESVLLTNGLDEGILTVSLALVPRDGQPSDVVVVEPGYGMYGPSAKLAGATVRSAEPGPGLSFDLDRVLAAITPATRFVVLSNPNNPAGEVIPESSLLALARALPAGAFLFVDEAYADFAGNCAISAIATEPNLIVGRTFAKAYGLAGIRIGAVFARPEVIARLRGAIPPFSVNVFAVAALEAALKDRGYLEWYLHQVTQAKYVLYEGFSRLGLPFWRSAGNFVLVRVGDAPGVRQALSERGIHVRDRSSAPGCEGCIRVTAGLPDEARACVAALEEVLCAARR